MKKQQGFTLIELMIVVAIVGILAAIALPAYNDYTIRARVSEVLTAASSVKASMAEEYLSGGAFPAAGDAIVTDMQNTFANTAYVAAAANAVYAAGNPATFTVTLSALGGDANGDTIVFSFSGNANGVDMTCTGGTLDAKYRPAECRA
ncbi:MAG: pilin [Gammaproteobacteria bacterium]